MRAVIITGIFLLFNVSYLFAQTSTYSSANQDTEVNSKANTQNDPGYHNRDMEKQEDPMVDSTGTKSDSPVRDEPTRDEKKIKEKKSKRYY